MNACRWILTTLALAAASLSAVSNANASTLDRNYKMGDDAQETNGGPVGNGLPVTTVTRDSQGVPGQAQLVHLAAVSSPVYRTISGRPDGGTGLGIEFSAASQQYLRGFNLGDPALSISTTDPLATLNYTGIADRGLQFWVRPTSTAVQTLVMDTNQHGVRINSNGKFSMRYGNVDFESTVSVVPNTWYHIEVVRPNTFANGSRMFVNGLAVAAAPGGYGADPAELVVGSNTAVDASLGTLEHFSGIIDDLKLFVIGTSTARTGPSPPALPAQVFGSFNFATDNDYVFDVDTGLKGAPGGVAGDVTNDGLLTNADKTAFIAGWLKRQTVNGIQVGDLTSHLQGDLNFDGITNIFDLALLQTALSGAGIGTITVADFHGVPEPSTAILAILAVAVAPAGIRRKARRRA